MLLIKRLALLSAFSLFCSCNSSSTSVNNPAPVYTYTVSGTIRDDQGIAIPSDAKVVCVWPNGTDYANLKIADAFGTSTTDLKAGTFSISFSGAAPALTVDNPGRHLTLGYGHFLLLSNSSSLKRNFGPEFGAIYGAVDNEAVVYHTSDFQLNGMKWINALPQGFAAGIGVIKDSSSVDDFQSGPNAGLELKVDTIGSHFHFPQLIPGQQVLM